MSKIDTLRNMTNEEWLDVMTEAQSVSHVLRRLELSDVNSYRKYISNKAKELNIPFRDNKINATRNKEQIKLFVQESLCWSDLLRKMNLLIHGANVRVVKRFLDLNNIDYTHFDKLTASARNTIDTKPSDQEVFCKNTTVTNATVKRRYLCLKTTIYECCICKNPGKWLGKPLNLQLDHIDGDRTNNCIDNLRLLCHNCHSQTPTYGRKKRVIDHH